MTTSHYKAVLAADEAYQNVQASEGIEHLTSEQQHMRGVAAAISAYLSAIGGVVCAREPVAIGIQRWGEIVGFIPGGDINAEYRLPEDDLPRIPLHAPIPEAGNGDGWLPVPDEMTSELIAAATKGKQVLVYDNGSYYNAWLEFDEFEGGWLWMDEADSEPSPSHYRPLPSPPSIRSSDTGRDG